MCYNKVINVRFKCKEICSEKQGRRVQNKKVKGGLMNEQTILIFWLLQLITKTIYSNKILSAVILIGVIGLGYFINENSSEKEQVIFSIDEKIFRVSSLLIISIFSMSLFYESTILLFILVLFDLLIVAAFSYLKRKVDKWVNDQ